MKKQKSNTERLREYVSMFVHGYGVDGEDLFDLMVFSHKIFTQGAAFGLSYAEVQEIINSITKHHSRVYDPKFGDSKLCICTHSYYRHFDSYEDMAPVGCKYCRCDTFKEMP